MCCIYLWYAQRLVLYNAADFLHNNSHAIHFEQVKFCLKRHFTHSKQENISQEVAPWSSPNFPNFSAKKRIPQETPPHFFKLSPLLIILYTCNSWRPSRVIALC